MARITLQGNPFDTSGDLPKAGDTITDFKLVDLELGEKTLKDFAGKKKILNIFPSIDTPVCATSVRSFHEKVAARDDLVVLNVSADLPFAGKRFCAAEGIENAAVLSTFRSGFGEDYGVLITGGPLEGLLSRAVIAVDENNVVVHAEQVGEIADEPNYDAALAAL